MERFKSGELLSADRLNELLEGLVRLEGRIPGAVASRIPCGVAGQPGLAWFNDSGVGEDGEVEEPEYVEGDYAGLMAGARVDVSARALRISDGVLVLPAAQSDMVVEPEGEGESPEGEVEVLAGCFGMVRDVGVNFDGVWSVRDGMVNVPAANSTRTEVDAESGESVVVPGVPGVMWGAQVDGAAEEVGIRDGVLRLPLAGCDSSAGVFSRAGLLSGVVAEDGAMHPRISDGVLYVPSGGNVVCDTESGRVGVVRDVGVGSSWCVEDGHIRVPAAVYDPAGGVSAVAGVVSGVRYGAGSVPRIVGGVLELPPPGGGGQDRMIESCVVEESGDAAGRVDDLTLRLFLAQDSSVVQGGRAGLVRGIGYSTDGGARVVDGEILLPAVPGVSFDPEWFEVVDEQVTLREEALAAVAEELAAEMSVEVSGTGVLEGTYSGTLRANTEGSLTLNTNVTY